MTRGVGQRGRRRLRNAGGDRGAAERPRTRSPSFPTLLPRTAPAIGRTALLTPPPHARPRGRGGGGGGEPAERPALEPAHTLARDAELARDAVERSRRLSADAVAQLDDPPPPAPGGPHPRTLAAAERRQRRTPPRGVVAAGDEHRRVGRAAVAERLGERGLPVRCGL